MKSSDLSLYQDTEDYTVHIYENHEEWLKGRSNNCIGGSSASSLIDMNPYKDLNTLWKEHKGIIIPEDISDKPYVKYGNEAEPLLRDLFALDYADKYEVQYVENVVIKSKKHSFMSYSPDGLLLDKQTGKRGILEIKTTNILQSMQREKWDDKVPDNYFIQVLHGLLTLNFDFVVLKAQLKTEWDGELRITTKHYYFTREEIQDQLDWLEQEEITRYNRYFVGNEEPPIELNF